MKIGNTRAPKIKISVKSSQGNHKIKGYEIGYQTPVMCGGQRYKEWI